MNYSKSNPAGVDKPIEKIKDKLYKVLRTKGEIDAYGRVYKNKRGGGFVLEAFKGDNEYKDVLGTDTSRFFFVVDERKVFDEDPSSVIDVVFMVDLRQFYNDDYRNDEEFKAMVNTVLESSKLKVSDMHGHERMDTILRGFGSGKSLEYDHIHPKLVFSVQGTVNYNLKTCI